MENIELGETDRRILEFVLEQRRKAIFPSIREIGDAVGLRSSSTVQTHVMRLTKLGIFDRTSKESRSIRVRLPEDQVCPCCNGTGIRKNG